MWAHRVDDKCLGIANVRQMRSELDRFDEFLPALEAAPDAKRQHGTEAPLAVVFLGHVVVPVIRPYQQQQQNSV